MATIKVAKQFMLQRDPQPVEGRTAWIGDKEVPVLAAPELLLFNPGEYEVEDDIANHWYVLPHLEGYVDELWTGQGGQPVVRVMLNTEEAAMAKEQAESVKAQRAEAAKVQAERAEQAEKAAV
jgi:hypothetical protein